MKDLCPENYKTLMKEMEEHINKWRDSTHSWIQRIYIVKMTILPKTIKAYQNTRPIKIPMIFLTEPKKFLIFMESKYYKYSKEF
jgi:hypothetical protein